MTLKELQAKCDAHCPDTQYGNCMGCNINTKKNDILNENKRRITFNNIYKFNKNIYQVNLQTK